MSGVNIGERQVQSAADAIQKHVESLGRYSQSILMTVQEVPRRGSTPLLVSDGPRVRVS